ncbi:cobalamin adenosyltransferase, partial [Escherichia sp. E4930]
MNVEKFDWTEELHQTMVKSLVTSFGLDFLLLNDRKGGDVDTIHNVRNGIYATEAERQRYEGRG